MRSRFNIRAALLPALLLGGCLSFAPSRSFYREGVYQGQGRGYRGPVEVMVRIEAGGIADMGITSHGEDPLVGGAAMEELLEAVLSSGSTEVDGISGATESAAGFLAAVEDALGKAALK